MLARTHGERPPVTVWIEQLAEDGVLLCNVLNSLDGGLGRITKTTAGCASGHFLPSPAYFMSLRGSRTEQPPVAELVHVVTQSAGEARSPVIPPDLGDDSFRLFAALHMPDVVWFGTPGAASVEAAPSLVGLNDGSWARTDLTNGGARVTQNGNRLLITPDKQWAWLDDPASEHQWPVRAVPPR